MIRWLLAIAVAFAGVDAVTPARAGVDSDRDACSVGRWHSTLAMLHGSVTCLPLIWFRPFPEALDGSRVTLCAKLSAALAKPGFGFITTAPTSTKSSFPGIS
jgi:hypothetical protein